MDFLRAFLTQLNFPQTKEEFKKFWKRGRKNIFFILGIMLVLGLLSPFFVYFYFASDLVSKEAIMNSNNAGVLLTDRTGKPFFSFYAAKQRKFVPLSQIPQYMQDAVISSEDKDFYKHPGFSLSGIFRSIFLDIQSGKLAYGGSTITQQLVKNALLTSQRNFLRKYQELILAAEIERRYSKKEILEMYLNSVYFGEGALGVEEAAHTYFGKKAIELDLPESALLTAILPAPSAFSPISGNKNESFRRKDRVLKKMEQLGYISKTEEEQAVKKQIVFHPTIDTTLNYTAPHFALMVKKQLLKTYTEEQLARSGFVVITTLNLAWQKVAENAVKNQVYYLRFNKATNAGVVVEDPKTGEIEALVGSYDWNDPDFGKFNITTALRQPGSSFKPLMYAKAFADKTITPGTVLEDKKITFPGNFTPKNYDGTFRGPVLPRRALANSLNIPAVEVMQKIGVNNGIEFAKQLGITSLQDPSHYGLSLILGGGEVSLLEMTNAYAVFANGGKLVSTTTILEIKNKRGDSIYTYTPKTQQVLSQQVSFLISSILSDNTARNEVFGNALKISRPAAVKTGTTNDYRDAWTIGYAPGLVIGVWVGNNDNSPMNSVAGSLGAAPIWRTLMQSFLQKTPIEHFTPPPGLSLIRICKDNGLKSNIATSSAYLEYFLPGTDPTQNCNEKPTASPIPSETPTPTETPTPSSTPVPTVLENPTETPIPTAQLTPTSTPELTPPLPSLTPTL